MPDGYVVGVDAGATRTRCALVDLDGNVLGRGTGGGANPNSGEADLAAPLIEALRDALRDARHGYGISPAEARGGVFGVAGAGEAGRDRAAEAATRAWRTCGLPGTPHTTDDLVIAFASGTLASPTQEDASGSVGGKVGVTVREGVLLLSGTGAVAAAIRDGGIVRRADGAGWLVGDDGSAVWLAREGTRAALAALEGRGPKTALAAAIPEALGVTAGAEPVQGVIKAVYAEPPARLGRIAPVVTTAAATDPVAEAICAEAARLLLGTLDAVLGAVETGPVVFAGGVLTAEGPVSTLVRTGVAERGREVVLGEDGALGAAAMARQTVARAGDG